MSLALDGDPKTSRGILVKTHGYPESFRGVVEISGPGFSIEIGFRDFVAMAHYVLTNTDLEVNDPRLAFVEAVKRMGVSVGFNGPPSVRLTGPYPKM